MAIQQTILYTEGEIQSHLRQLHDVLLYFKDSDVPAYVVDVQGNSVKLLHGGRIFYIRVNNTNVAKIVYHRIISQL